LGENRFECLDLVCKRLDETILRHRVDDRKRSRIISGELDDMGKQTELFARYVKNLLYALAGQWCSHALEDVSDASEPSIYELGA
jgi:hypothetical protein